MFSTLTGRQHRHLLRNYFVKTLCRLLSELKIGQQLVLNQNEIERKRAKPRTKLPKMTHMSRLESALIPWSTKPHFKTGFCEPPRTPYTSDKFPSVKNEHVWPTDRPHINEGLNLLSLVWRLSFIRTHSLTPSLWSTWRRLGPYMDPTQYPSHRQFQQWKVTTGFAHTFLLRGKKKNCCLRNTSRPNWPFIKFRVWGVFRA